MLAASPGAEAAPAPCLTCGAPMSVGTGEGIHGVPELTCGYCGRREQLPPDAAQRHQHLRLRLLQLKRARETAEAPLATYRAIKQAVLPGAVMMLVIQAVVLVPRLAQGEVNLFTLLPVAVFAGMGAGWLAMILTFRAMVTPLLRARPPAQPGLAARCRSCGGELPQVLAPKVVCRYCSADNLLDDRLAADASELLRREADEYHARARTSGGKPPDFGKGTRAFYVWGAIAFVLTVLLLEGVLRAMALASRYVDLT